MVYVTIYFMWYTQADPFWNMMLLVKCNRTGYSQVLFVTHSQHTHIHSHVHHPRTTQRAHSHTQTKFNLFHISLTIIWNWQWFSFCKIFRWILFSVFLLLLLLLNKNLTWNVLCANKRVFYFNLNTQSIQFVYKYVYIFRLLFVWKLILTWVRGENCVPMYW